jgi:hypothetical protein
MDYFAQVVEFRNSRRYSLPARFPSSLTKQEKMSDYAKVLLLCLSFFSLSALASESNAEVYEFRVHDDVTGTSLGYTRKIKGPTPFDKTYAELTPAQQNRLRSEYTDLGPNDEPPFPRDGLGDFASRLFRLRDRLRGKGIDVLGDFLIVAGVSPEGTINNVTFYEAPSNAALRNLVVKVLLELPFKPGMRDGKPEQMDYLIEFKLAASCSTSASSTAADESCK